jgi:hypothetical protein
LFFFLWCFSFGAFFGAFFGMVQAACKPQPGRNFPDFNIVRTVQNVVEVVVKAVVEAREVVGTLSNKKTRGGGDPE